MKLLPGYYNLGQPRKIVPTRPLSLKWLCVDVVARYRAPVPLDSKNLRPFALLMGQTLYHSGKMSTKAPGLITIGPEYWAAQDEPSRYGTARSGRGDDGAPHVGPRFAAIDGAARSIRSLPQTCFFPEHFNEPPVKDLMSVHVDPTTGVPSFKQTRVTIEKA